MKKIIFVLISTLFYLNFSFAVDLKAKLIRVVSGDLIIVRINGKIRKVTLCGIDAPENRKNRRIHYQAWKWKKRIWELRRLGREATRYLRSIISKNLILRNVHKDRYGRILAYVFNAEDGLFINEEMIKNGYAFLVEYPIEEEYLEIFKEALEYAKKNKKGVWK